MITVKPLPPPVLAQFSVDGIPDRRHVTAGNPREKLGIASSAATASVLASPRLASRITPRQTLLRALFSPETPRRGIIKAGLGVLFRARLIVTEIYPRDL